MKIVILGGGISGLSAAWYLKKKQPKAEITLLEKENRVGGWIDTGPFQFERGPRTFLVSRSSALLTLIDELGLKEELLFSDPQAKSRFLWHRGKLRTIESFWPLILSSCAREFFRKKGQSEDESIYDFAVRRFNSRIAETFFDPMTLGIFGGDVRTLSLRSCFPSIYAMEQEHGSLLRAWLKMKKAKGPKGLFTLKRGMKSLIMALESQLRIQIVRDAAIESIAPNGAFAKGKFWGGDLMISALPGQALGEITGLWTDFPTASLWVVNAAFQQNVFPKRGYGYLAPTNEQEDLLGMIWDSSIFPSQNQERLCRLTAMIRPFSDSHWAQSVTADAVSRHLGSPASPLFMEARLAKQAIPQFVVGYEKRLMQFKQELREKFPHVTPIGNYWGNPSVEGCIQLAKQTSNEKYIEKIFASYNKNT